jgi:hypothetical protein
MAEHLLTSQKGLSSIELIQFVNWLVLPSSLNAEIISVSVD